MEHIYIDIDNLVLVENKYILYMVYTDVLTYIQKTKLYVIYIYTLYIYIYIDIPIVTTQEQSMFKFMKCYKVLILTIQNLKHEYEYIYACIACRDACVSVYLCL